MTHTDAHTDRADEADDRNDDALDGLRAQLADIEQRPMAEHVQVLSASLDAIVGELDELARSIPPAR